MILQNVLRFRGVCMKRVWEDLYNTSGEKRIAATSSRCYPYGAATE